jgi:hypothetical protein
LNNCFRGITADTNAVILPNVITGNYQILFDNTASVSTKLFAIYLKYTDVNNYVKLTLADTAGSTVRTRRIIVKTAGVSVTTNYVSYGDSCANHRYYRIDVIDNVIHMYEDNLLTQVFPMPSTSFANKVGITTGGYTNALINYFYVKQLA